MFVMKAIEMLPGDSLDEKESDQGSYKLGLNKWVRRNLERIYVDLSMYLQQTCEPAYLTARQKPQNFGGLIASSRSQVSTGRRQNLGHSCLCQ